MRSRVQEGGPRLERISSKDDFTETEPCMSPCSIGKTFIAAVIMFNYYRWFPKGKVRLVDRKGEGGGLLQSFAILWVSTPQELPILRSGY